MRSLIASVAIVALTTMMVGTVVWGAETSVTATVTAQVVALSISNNSSIAYGTISTSTDTTSSGINKSPTVKNDGNVNEKFQLKGTNSADWTLAASAGDHAYKHAYCSSDCDTAPSWTALTTSYSADVFTGITPTSTQDFDLQITVPTSNAGTNQENVNVSVQATT